MDWLATQGLEKSKVEINVDKVMWLSFPESAKYEDFGVFCKNPLLDSIHGEKTF